MHFFFDLSNADFPLFSFISHFGLIDIGDADAFCQSKKSLIGGIFEEKKLENRDDSNIDRRLEEEEIKRAFA